MQLALKPDFDEAAARLEAWWHCEVLDRPCVQFTIARQGDFPPMPTKQHATLRDRWMDVEHQVMSAAAGLERREYIGEAFPSYMPNLGPDICATLLGAELEFMPGTTWVEPIVDDWSTVDFTPRYDGEYWQTIRDMTKLSLEVGAGRFVTAITDLHTNGDLLSAMRGREEICLDIMDRPEELRSAIDAVGALYEGIYNDLWHPIRERGLGSTTWMSVYHQAGRCYGTNMDLAGLMSPAAFEDLFLPIILDEIRFLDRSCFHLDGPTALPHLDTLLAIPELNGVQWVYGAGQGPATRWIDVYRRIQAAGKCAQVIVEDLSEIEVILAELPPEGLLFTGGGGGLSRDEADAVLRGAERACARHRR
jgi:hypothetical protein